VSFSLPQEIARVGRVGEDSREDVGVGVGVVECGLYTTPQCVLLSVYLNSSAW